MSIKLQGSRIERQGTVNIHLRGTVEWVLTNTPFANHLGEKDIHFREV